MIEQAKGVLAERAGLAMEEAFERLRTYARRRSLRLSDVARALLDGTLAPELLQGPEVEVSGSEGAD
jgi:AmiR/NasT family two-component response regulator